MPELFDVVELTVDLPSFGLYAGMQGTIIEAHDGSDAYEVEFSNEEGEATNWLALPPKQIVVVWQARTEKWLHEEGR